VSKIWTISSMVDIEIPFPKVNLQYLCSQLKVERDRSHEAMQDCVATAEVYRKMLRDAIVQLPFQQRMDEQSISNFDPEMISNDRPEMD
jgi:DNA polymerase III epsilon subunit-like protein